MDFFNILTMVGGLAMFLYGMQVMGDGLEKLSGGKLEKILENLSSNRVKAVLVGAAVTAIIQSSSATTVMVVGFVNSGIMHLSQAVGFIMGANIGTTVTAWILSLAGIESSNFFVRLLNPSSFSLILALIGVIFIVFLHDEKKKDIGNILVGFAVLMFGMNTMSGAVKPLAQVPEFTNILLKFSNPVLGVLAGALLTAIIQSSSASVGILQALCVTGAVRYGTALPIIMGQNIGTCITAMLSSIGATKNAKRAAIVHLYFNIVGTVAFMVVFYVLNGFLHFSFIEEVAGPAGIAVIHSAFNVIATVVLLPFGDLLVKMACATVRDTNEEKAISAEDQEFMILESRFLSNPGIAIEQSKTAAKKMAEQSKTALNLSFGLLDHFQEETAFRVEKIEAKVDRYEDELGTYLIKLNQKDLSLEDSHSLSIMLHCIGDFERISDHALSIMKSAREISGKNASFSPKAVQELHVMEKAVSDIVEKAYNVFANQDMKMAEEIEPLEEVIDELSRELKRRHVNRLRAGECTIEMGFVLSDITTSLERIADHCSNIGVCVTQVREDLYDTHSHLDTVKNAPGEHFHHELEVARVNYMLP